MANPGNNMYPDFLGIGAMRSGTTWLNENLRRHPEVWVPPLKELHYFDERELIESKTGLERLRATAWRMRKRWRRVTRSARKKRKKMLQSRGQTLRWYIRYIFGRRTDLWYASLFLAAGDKVKGEITPEYGPLRMDTVERVHTLMPDARLILMVRNPMHRAWSHILKKFRDRGMSLDEVSDAELIRHFDSEASQAKGDYVRILQTWRSHYREEQIFLGFFEEITESPQELLLRIFEFIGVEPDPKHISAKVHKRYNATQQPDEIPPAFAQHLAMIYRDEIEQLTKVIGGYSFQWLREADRLMADAPTDTMPPQNMTVSKSPESRDQMQTSR